MPTYLLGKGIWFLSLIQILVEKREFECPQVCINPQKIFAWYDLILRRIPGISMKTPNYNRFRSIALPTLITAIFISTLTACASNNKEMVNLSHIAQPFRLLEPGHSYIQRISGPGAIRDITWVFKGEENMLYRWDLYRNGNTEGSAWRTHWYNTNGSSVRQQESKATGSWSPHNCFRVLGECSFTYKDDFGIEKNYIRQSSFDGKVWTYQLFRVEEESRSLVTNGEAQFDLNGIEIFHEYFTNNNGHQLSKVTKIF